jgi:transposase
VAAEIGVEEQLLGRCVHLEPDSAGGGDTGPVLDADDRAKLQRLRRANAALQVGPFTQV